MTAEKHYVLFGIQINIHICSLVSVISLFLADSCVYSLIVLFCVVLHELGHVTAIYFYDLKVSSISFLPFGLEIKTEGQTNYRQDFFVALAGPFFNLVSSAVCAVLFRFLKSPEVLFCGICSLFLAGINLIPVRSFDGGRAVKSLAFLFAGYEKALKIIHFSELFSLIILCFVSCSAVILCNGNISLAVICIYIFVSAYLNCFDY